MSTGTRCNGDQTNDGARAKTDRRPLSFKAGKTGGKLVTMHACAARKEAPSAELLLNPVNNPKIRI